MKVIIVGANGQLGGDLKATVPHDINLFPYARPALYITSPESVDNIIKSHQPDIIINAAAYTAVDKAESEPDLAYAVNAEGAANLARAARSVNARLIHISTDFVFDGTKSTPYLPEDPVNPLGAYGSSKARGEQLVLDIYPGGALIIRTSWLYSRHGKNFVKTMLRLMAEHDAIRVVADQTGTPTWSKNLATTIWEFIHNNAAAGVYHWSDAGVTTWYGFARAIYEEGRKAGLVRQEVKIAPITTEEYPTRARRPAYSVLDKQSSYDVVGHEGEPWRDALGKMLTELRNTINE